jgi:4-hydroxy-3-methylbut-2-enyl diphosphate reductase
MMNEQKVYQRGLGLKDKVQTPLKQDYEGALVERARASNYLLKAGDLILRLAKEFGFCYGVERAVEYAYEARVRFPDRKIYITGEIIHNPYVNQRLKDMGIVFLTGSYGSEEKFEPVSAEDVVLLPAFGVSTDELAILKRKGSVLVDTTCGSVLNVWKNVERYARDGFTSIVHGKYWHEETKATVSRALKFTDGHYLVVRDMEETDITCSFITHGGEASSFFERFENACSPGFDPTQHLGRIGLANQTTMLSSESLAIADKLRLAIIKRYGEAEIDDRFRSFDTICSATQERQDAVIDLAREGVDVMIVIGGYNSSNTTHLAEISSEYCPTYHIAGSSCLVSAEQIRHKPPGGEETTSRQWLPSGPVRIGVTAGASTPDVKVDESIRKILTFRGLRPADIETLETSTPD